MDNYEMTSGAAIYTWMDLVMPISHAATDGWRDRSRDIASFGFTGLGNAGSNIHHRLASGIDRFLISDLNQTVTDQNSGASMVPIMWDQISTNVIDFNHIPTGQNVLYMDGHVEFQRYLKSSLEFPISPLYASFNGSFLDKPSDYCP